MLYSIRIIHSAFSVKYNEIVERMDNDGIEFVMEDRISLLQLTGLNPFADQDFFPAKRFHSKSLQGKKQSNILPSLCSSERYHTGYPTVLVGKLPIATSAERGR